MDIENKQKFAGHTSFSKHSTVIYSVAALAAWTACLTPPLFPTNTPKYFWDPFKKKERKKEMTVSCSLWSLREFFFNRNDNLHGLL